MRPLSIVITTCDGFALTRFCIESILATLPPKSYELIIVDDGSHDQTQELRQFFRFVDNEGGGLYRSWNLGIEAAAFEYVAILNNDVFFCVRDWWQRMFDVFEQSQASYLFPATIECQAFPASIYETIGDAQRDLARTFEATPGQIEACAFIIPRSLIDEIGPFDTAFRVWYGEKDFEVRLLRFGKRYGRVRTVVARHFGSSTLGLALRGTDALREKRPEDVEFRAFAEQDYSHFCRKHTRQELEVLGLTLPPFGPHPLKII